MSELNNCDVQDNRSGSYILPGELPKLYTIGYLDPPEWVLDLEDNGKIVIVRDPMFGRVCRIYCGDNIISHLDTLVLINGYVFCRRQGNSSVSLEQMVTHSKVYFGN